MITLLLIADNKDAFADLSRAVSEYKGVTTLQADSGEKALAMVASRRFDLVISDEILCDMDGLSLSKKLVKHDPMIHCALVSRLSEAAFHEASEGLGLLAKLPPHPSTTDARNLLERLESIIRQIPS